ncbi:hypothetical protein [Pseudomonas mandelii]|uniref:hypothetical protein n=1 Tax=Pseudomonas mandelii TaxID=75612 RepID=UPI0012B1A556|nr:hypothetical protein [Pseudomonas mandelii]
MMGFGAQARQITVVYAKDYESGANIIEARIQAFSGYTSRLWDISFYEANKATLDSDQRVLFLGDFDENPAAGKYEKVFDNREKGRGCIHAIAGSKALIYPTGDASDDTIWLTGGAQFHTDSKGNTTSGNEPPQIDVANLNLKPTILRKAAFGILGMLADRLLTPNGPTKQQQLENGCEEFMEKRFAKWVGFTPS